MVLSSETEENHGQMPSANNHIKHAIHASNCNNNNDPNIPRNGSGKSLSSLSSLSSCTSQTKEICENLHIPHQETNDHPHLHLAITPPAISPHINDHINQHNAQNDVHNGPPMLSALSMLHKTKFQINHREVDVSPHQCKNDNDNDNNLEHQDLKFIHYPAKHNGNSKRQSIIKTLWTSFQSISMSTNENENDHENQDNDEQKYDHVASQNEELSILQNEEFMDDAITMYGHLDTALSNINHLKMQKVEQLRECKATKSAQPKSNAQSMNDEVVKVMKTLLSSTTKMSTFFVSNDADDKMDGGSSSLIGRSLDKLSSSIAYMSYISLTKVTPFIYNMVEAVLLELYATIKDIIEYYDPDPKNNILYRLISKMNEIIEAIHGLMALSECFYEINSEQSDEDKDENEDGDDKDKSSSSYSLFDKKVKKD